MKLTVTILLAFGLAQAQEKAAAPAKPEAAPAAAEQAKPEGGADKAAAGASAESPNPSPERNLSVTFDTGYRFVSKIGGDPNTYRSVVNLGEGPKLFGAEATIVDPGHRIFDRLSINAHSWGGDPYNTLRVQAERTGIYRFTGDYRNIQYFNFLPSWANPNAPQTLISERAYDARRRYSNFDLELMPGRWIVPYFSFMRDQGSGRGITPYVANGNEYPAAMLLDDRSNIFRGGVRFEQRRWHASLEQGGGTYGDDQRIVNSTRNLGDRTTLAFDQRLFLNDLLQSYGVTGRNIFTKGLLSASPWDCVNLYGSFIYSRPNTDVQYTDRGTGLFLIGAGRFFNTFQTVLSSEAKMPRSSGNVAGEFRIGRRVRVLESFWTDRFHNAGSALLAEQFLTGTAIGSASQLYSAERLVVNYNRQQIEGFFDVLPKLTLRGGHRYVFGNAVTPRSLLSNGLPESGDIRMNVGLAGMNFRPTGKLNLNIDYEGSAGDKSYFRTSLHDYQQVRGRARAQILPDLRFSANLHYLSNNNPNTSPAAALRNFLNYDMQSWSLSGALEWLPKGGKYVSVLTEYTRSSLTSDIQYLEPQALLQRLSHYRDDGHMVTALVDIHPRGTAPHVPYLAIGGSLFQSGGTRPANYYQPLARLSVPVSTMVEFYGEWKWYGMTESLYLYEGFRVHTGVIGLRVTH